MGNRNPSNAQKPAKEGENAYACASHVNFSFDTRIYRAIFMQVPAFYPSASCKLKLARTMPEIYLPSAQ